MTGLRERKKKATREKILSVARDLFNDEGFDRTSLEQVALTADVSVGTVYNYFATKQDLLSEVIFSASVDLVETSRRILKRRPKNPVELFMRVVHTLYESGEAFERALLRQAYTVAMNQTDAVAKSHNEKNKMFEVLFEDLLRELEASGELRAGTDVMAAASLLFNIANSEFQNYLSLRHDTAKEAITATRRQIATLMNGLRA